MFVYFLLGINHICTDHFQMHVLKGGGHAWQSNFSLYRQSWAFSWVKRSISNEHSHSNKRAKLSKPREKTTESEWLLEVANSVVKSCNGDYANAPVTLTRKLLPLLRLSMRHLKHLTPFGLFFFIFLVHLSTISTEYIVKRRVVRNCLNFS